MYVLKTPIKTFLLQNMMTAPWTFISQKGHQNSNAHVPNEMHIREGQQAFVRKILIFCFMGSSFFLHIDDNQVVNSSSGYCMGPSGAEEVSTTRVELM